jgi:Tfp pilus assembly protein FimV
MAAVMTTPRSLERYPAEEISRPVHLTLVPTSHPGVGCPPRVSATTYWRRRLAVLLGAVVLVLAAGQAAAALGSSPLAAPGRPPSVVRYVVQPGDSLWTVAGHVAPKEDPRQVVDALEQARHGKDLIIGETVTWQR